VYDSGRFAKQQQWERWRAKRKLVSGSKHLERFCGGTGVTPRKIFEILCGKSRNLVNFGREIVRNAVHNACNSNSRAFLKHFNNGNGIPRVPP